MHGTVSDALTADRLEAFVAHSLPRSGHLTAAQALNGQFEQLICTEFILNSNLIDNGFNFDDEFVEKAPACNPFSGLRMFRPGDPIGEASVSASAAQTPGAAA